MLESSISEDFHLTSQVTGTPLPYGLWEFKCGCNIIHRPTPEGIIQIIRCLYHSNIEKDGKYLRIIDLKPINIRTKVEVMSS